MKTLITSLILLSSISHAQLTDNKKYIGLRHSHSSEAKMAYNFMAMQLKQVLSKGRVQLFELKNDKKLSDLPAKVQKYFFEVSMKDLINPYTPKGNVKFNLKDDAKVQSALNNLSKESYQNFVENMVTIGNRRNGEAANYIAGELRKLGLEVTKDYNVIGTLKGKSDKKIVIVGHMDTVSNTVGADDNASGSSGVMEMAKAITAHYSNEMPNHTFVFLVTEDEEIGLRGAKAYVKAARRAGTADKIKFALNMDMVAYNSNGVLDLETDSKFKKQAMYMAEMAAKYTSLRINLVLNPWGSDHMPFINAGIPAVLSIENWSDHTPCWHKSCDTIETLNFDYAIELLKMNVATVVGLDIMNK